MSCPDGQFDEMVAGFYRAANSCMAWADALEPLKAALGASAVRLDAFDRAQQILVFSHATRGAEPAAARTAAGFDHLRGYYRADPRAAQLLKLAPGRWLSCPEHFDTANLRANLRPATVNGLSEATKVLEDGAVNVILGLRHREGAAPMSDAARVTCGRLAHHLAVALKMHGTGLAAHLTADLAGVLLAPLRAPVAIVDTQRHIVYRNPAAEGLFARTRVLTQAHGRLGCHRREDDNALDALLRELCRSDERGQSFLNARGTDCETSCGLYLHALRPRKEPGRADDDKLVMVLLHETAARIEVDPRVLAARYDLTQAEARVGAALANGLTPEAIADTHGVAITTVRSQLRCLLKKTGATRQTELISVLAGLSQSSPGLGSMRTGGAMHPRG